MTLPTYENLKTLDYAYDGCPFCNVGAADSVDLNGLDFAFQGEPFSGTIGSSGSSSTVAVNAMAAVAKISGGIAGIVSPIFLVPPAAIMAAAAIGQVLQCIMIAPPAATILATGSDGGTLSALAVMPGRINAGGSVVDIQFLGVVSPAPGQIVAGASIGGLLLSIHPPAAQAQTIAQVEQILRLEAPVIAGPGVVVGSGKVQGIGIVTIVHVEARIAIEPTIDGFLFALATAPADICVTGIAETDIWHLLSPVVTYRCVLTGAADGLPDIVIPISSFNIRKRAL
jgi:hypothetical protein